VSISGTLLAVSRVETVRKSLARETRLKACSGLSIYGFPGKSSRDYGDGIARFPDLGA
jgi:hypothetical protein